MPAPAGKFVGARDGDTVEVTFAVRLAGIKSDDGTELDKKAKERIQELCAGKRVDVAWFVGETTYRRLTGDIIVDGKSLVNTLYSEGLVQKIDRPRAPWRD